MYLNDAEFHASRWHYHYLFCFYNIVVKVRRKLAYPKHVSFFRDFLLLNRFLINSDEHHPRIIGKNGGFDKNLLKIAGFPSEIRGYRLQNRGENRGYSPISCSTLLPLQNRRRREAARCCIARRLARSCCDAVGRWASRADRWDARSAMWVEKIWMCEIHLVSPVSRILSLLNKNESVTGITILTMIPKIMHMRGFPPSTFN